MSGTGFSVCAVLALNEPSLLRAGCFVFIQLVHLIRISVVGRNQRYATHCIDDRQYARQLQDLPPQLTLSQRGNFRYANHIAVGKVTA